MVQFWRLQVKLSKLAKQIGWASKKFAECLHIKIRRGFRARHIKHAWQCARRFTGTQKGTKRRWVKNAHHFQSTSRSLPTNNNTTSQRMLMASKGASVFLWPIEENTMRIRVVQLSKNTNNVKKINLKQNMLKKIIPDKKCQTNLILNKKYFKKMNSI